MLLPVAFLQPTSNLLASLSLKQQQSKATHADPPPCLRLRASWLCLLTFCIPAHAHSEACGSGSGASSTNANAFPEAAAAASAAAPALFEIDTSPVSTRSVFFASAEHTRKDTHPADQHRDASPSEARLDPHTTPSPRPGPAVGHAAAFRGLPASVTERVTAALDEMSPRGRRVRPPPGLAPGEAAPIGAVDEPAMVSPDRRSPAPQPSAPSLPSSTHTRLLSPPSPPSPSSSSSSPRSAPPPPPPTLPPPSVLSGQSGETSSSRRNETASLLKEEEAKSSLAHASAVAMVMRGVEDAMSKLEKRLTARLYLLENRVKMLETQSNYHIDKCFP